MPTTTRLTRTFGAHSTASDRVSPDNPAFAAPYTAVPGEGRTPLTLPMLTIAPPSDCCCMTALAACATYNGASRLSATIFSAKRGDAVAASDGGDPPALLMATSRRPWMSTTSRTTRWTASKSRTSAARNDVPDGRLSGCDRDTTTTCAPASTKAVVMPRPTPLPPPVTNATRPLKSTVIGTCPMVTDDLTGIQKVRTHGHLTDGQRRRR